MSRWCEHSGETEIVELLVNAGMAGRDVIRRCVSRVGQIQVQQKADGSLVTDADYASQDAILRVLQKEGPKISVVTEENYGIPTTFEIGESFVIDPLDGTTNFSRGIELFSVSLAYVANGVPLVGVVMPVMEDYYFRAIRGKQSVIVGLIDGETVALRCIERSLEESVICVACDFNNIESRAMWHNWIKALTPPTCYRIRLVESAALELCWLAQGKVDAYMHPTDKPWDTAAGSIIVEGAGARLYGKTGKEWRLSECGILALTPRVADAILALVDV